MDTGLESAAEVNRQLVRFGVAAGSVDTLSGCNDRSFRLPEHNVEQGEHAYVNPVEH